MASSSQSVDLRSMLLFGLFFIVLSAFLLVYSLSTIARNTHLYWQLQSSQVAVVLQDTGFLFYYGGWVMLLALLLMGFYSLFLAYKGERPRSLDKKITKAMGYVLILGFILMISGKFAAQLYWTNAFEQAGYVECENSFGMTQSWSAKVWALNAESCRTPFDPHDIWQKQADMAKR